MTDTIRTYARRPSAVMLRLRAGVPAHAAWPPVAPAASSQTLAVTNPPILLALIEPAASLDAGSAMESTWPVRAFSLPA